MLRYMNCLLFILALTLGLVVGCTDRGTNVTDEPVSNAGILTIGHDFYDELKLQIGRNVGGQRVLFQMRGYSPEEAIPPIQGGQPKLVPLLILLAPQDGDEWYFFNHGLKQLADELVTEGSIQPMEILCIPNDRVFGGYFYAGHSAPAGYYDYFIGGSLIDYLHDTYPFLTDSLPVGIGGAGMGSYGAFRAALMHKGVFTSISATDGPLDFDGPDGNSGLMELFDDALIEQGLLGGTTDPPDSTWQCDSLEVDPLEDTICVESTLVINYPPSWTENFDSAGVWHLSRLFIGGALAFSPHDTLVDTTGVIRIKFQGTDHEELQVVIPDSQRFVLSDSTTLITNIIKLNQFNFDFHLPFDSTGNPYWPIWSMWLNNNLEKMILNDPSPGSQLRGVKMWFGTSPEFEFANYRQQTLSWIDCLRHSALDQSQIQVKEYTGYPGNPATNNQYLYDIMRDMLIFHSKCFEQQ